MDLNKKTGFTLEHKHVNANRHTVKKLTLSMAKNPITDNNFLANYLNGLEKLK